jgi:hypothetical protein
MKPLITIIAAQSKVKQGLRTLIINFQSVKNKVHVPQLDILLESTSPDIIIKIALSYLAFSSDISLM